MFPTKNPIINGRVYCPTDINNFVKILASPVDSVNISITAGIQPESKNEFAIPASNATAKAICTLGVTNTPPKKAI